MSKLNKAQAAERITQLREIINDYRHQLHVHDTSTMSEAAADSLKHELTQLEAQFPELITRDSPTQRVAGEPLPEFESVAHSRRMLSLNDVFSAEEVDAWLERIEKVHNGPVGELFADVKLDGFACALVYEDGILQLGLTRGDGFTGENITANIRTIESIPLQLSVKAPAQYLQGRTEVRGEIVMHNDDFEALNKTREAAGEELFKNPRNTAAGTVRQLDPRLVAERRMHFYAYDIVREADDESGTNANVYADLAGLGFMSTGATDVHTSAKDLMTYIETWETKREQLPFGTDGIVVKVNDRSVFRALGVVGKAPRAAAAYKYPAEEATTVVKDIIISIGRTGVATPVAVLDPVDVAGSTVQHASLHNEDEIAKKDIRIGDTVIIYKAGDIIPQVERVLLELRPKNTERFSMQAALASHELDFERDETAAAWRATNLNSPIVLKRAIAHYAAKGALDIDTLGEKNVDALVDAGLVSNIADIYAVTKDDLLKLERFADISAEKLVNAIQSAKAPALDKFIFGIGIRHVGAQTAIDLAAYFGDLTSIGEASFDELAQLDGIGEVVAHAIEQWFANEANQDLLARFAELGVQPQKYEQAVGPLSGKSFVITGSLSDMSREQAADAIRARGGTFQTSVGKTTNYLVYGKKIGDSKRAKAEKYGTEVIDEQAFQAMLDS